MTKGTISNIITVLNNKFYSTLTKVANVRY